MENSAESQQGELYMQVLKMEQVEGQVIILFPFPYFSASRLAAYSNFAC